MGRAEYFDARPGEAADADPLAPEGYSAYPWKVTRAESQSLTSGISPSSQGLQQTSTAGNVTADTLASQAQEDPTCKFLKDATPKSQLMFHEAPSLRTAPVPSHKDATPPPLKTGPQTIQVPGTHIPDPSCSPAKLSPAIYVTKSAASQNMEAGWWAHSSSLRSQIRKWRP